MAEEKKDKAVTFLDAQKYLLGKITATGTDAGKTVQYANALKMVSEAKVTDSVQLSELLMEINK